VASGEGRVGEVLIGKYELAAFLEHGQYADFFRAIRRTDGREVAIKILRPELLGVPEALRRFEREVRTLARFKHPNLLRVFALGRTEEGVPFVVTEYVEGRLLSHEIADLSLTIEQICHIGAQVSLLLAATHKEGIIHRGLSPDSIYLVDQEGDSHRVKVLDFGLAHFTEGAGEEGITRVGQRLGRCEYMAPEYIEAYTLDGKTDLYVLGVMLFEMLTGQPPFVGRAVSVMDKHLNETPWAPSEMSEHDVPPWLDELILALLAKNPANRPSSAQDVAAAFAEGCWPVTQGASRV
jgi:eukaryotic-like serine/threonine-protein kinase